MCSDGEMEECCVGVVENKTNLVSSSEGRAVSEEAALDFINELAPSLGSPSNNLATSEDQGDWTHTYVFNHVSSGSNAEVIIHDNGTLDSDIILVDEAHFGVVHHFISTRAMMSVLTGKT